MKERRQVVSILFSDMKGYSEINDDNLYVQVKKFNDEFERQFLNPDNHFFRKTWGDAFFICSNDPVDMAEIALNLRDKFRNTNWRRMGFGVNLSVRVGLHAELARILFADNGEIKDVVGLNINSTARIEPIVESNQVYCSETFYKHLSNEEHIKFVSLGRRQLAKNFGELELYQLLRAHDVAEPTVELAKPTRFKIPQAKVRKEFTDKDLNDFLRDSFNAVSLYFQEALRQLDEQDSDVKTDFQRVSAEKFTCHVYVRGANRGQCQIWIWNDFGGNDIRYAQGRHFNDNSFNESISVRHDGFDIYLEATGLQFFVGKQERLKTPEEAAKHLWRVFTKTLE